MAQKSLKLNAAMNTIRVISTMIFPMITFPYTSRILGPEGTGKVSFATSFVSYFILLASIGIPLYGIREIARVRDNKEALSNTAQELFVMHLILSVIFFFSFLLLISLNGKLYDEKSLFFIISFSIILTALGMDWLYQGLEEYSYITIRSIVFSIISTVAIFIFIHNKEDYIISAAIGVFAALGSSVLNFYNARKIIFVKRSKPWNFKRHLKPLSMVFLMNFIISIYVQIDTVMLGFMSTAKNVGYYSTALKLTKMLLGLVTSMGSVFLPRLSYYIANEQKDDFKILINKSFSIIFIFCLPIVVSLMLLSKEIIVVVAGNLYLPASFCLVITAPIIIFIGVTNILGIQILYPLGEEKKNILSTLAGAVVSVSLNLLLIPYFAYNGAAIATLFSELAVLIIMFYQVPKEYLRTIQIDAFMRYIYATVLLIGLLILIKFYINQLWLRLFIAIPLGMTLYFGILLLLKEEFIVEIFIKFKVKVNIAYHLFKT